MGGIKKKTLSAMEKEVLRKQQEEAQKEKKKKEQKEQKSTVKVDATGKVDEKAALSLMRDMGAVTLYGLAKGLGVRASTANHIIRSFESKGFLQRVGGYQGHYVYTLVVKGPK